MPNTQYQKSTLQAYNITPQTLKQNNEIVLSSIDLLSGCSIRFTAGGTDIILKKPGIYSVIVDAVITADSSSSPTTGTATMQIQNNDTAILGASSSADISEATSVATLSTSALVKVDQSCCCNNCISSIVSIINSGISVTYSSINVVVYKLC